MLLKKNIFRMFKVNCYCWQPIVLVYLLNFETLSFGWVFNIDLIKMPKSRVIYMYKPEVSDFKYSDDHLMKPHRIALTNNLVLNYGLHRHMMMYRPLEATREDVLQYHSPEYVNFLEKVVPGTDFSTDNPFNFGPDCPAFDGLFKFVSMYTGASISAARHLVNGTGDIAINWSGGLHHAKRVQASGFCYVNDIVIAVLELLRHYPRVLYIDIDVHHGDGVEQAFYLTDRVMTVSFHHFAPGFFPETGDYTDVGKDKGKHYSVNVPLKQGITSEMYVDLFKAVITDVMDSYRPSCIVLQCGADSLAGDVLGNFNLSIQAHGACVHFVRDFRLPLLVLGGGGYTVRNVARCWTYETAILVGKELRDELPYTEYLEYFNPEYTLCPKLATKFENKNTPRYIQAMKIAVHENLRYVSAPSVAMQSVPSPPCITLDSSSDEEVEVYPPSKSSRMDVEPGQLPDL